MVSRKIKIFAIVTILIFVAIYYYPLPEDIENPPQFCTADFIELNKIQKISKFRSFAGHDYSDSFEQDRSMKHYFDPIPEFGSSNDNITIYSPVDGTIKYLNDEMHRLSNGDIRGKQIGIKVKNHEDYTVIIFHLNPFANISVGVEVHAGEAIGFADVRENSNTDIAIQRSIPIFKTKLYSYFEVMTDDVFNNYQARGISSRSQLIKSKEVVDSLTPNWGEYNEDDWVVLSQPLFQYQEFMSQMTISLT